MLQNHALIHTQQFQKLLLPHVLCKTAKKPTATVFNVLSNFRHYGYKPSPPVGDLKRSCKKYLPINQCNIGVAKLNCPQQPFIALIEHFRFWTGIDMIEEWRLEVF